MNKVRARAIVRRRLEAIDAADLREKSERICQTVAALGEFRSADPILLYMALAGEVQTAPLARRAWQTGKTVLAPKVDWTRRTMQAVPITHWTEGIVRGRYGICEPELGEPAGVDAIGLVIVPALAFDIAGSRLGRGGGFYDRFLSQPGFAAVTCGVALEAQILEDLPHEPHDVPVDLVVTEERTIRSHETDAVSRAQE
jgi:5-formyltetrahydrofolate cyclo-ligase